jgi:hypothetical protein
LVVNLGNVTNFIAFAPGKTIDISAFSPTQLSDAFPDGFQNLQWSVSAGFPGLVSWAGYPKSSIWYSLPAPDASTQSQTPQRYGLNAQLTVQKRIQGIGTGAYLISTGLGATNADNNVRLVREPYDPNSIQDLTYFMGDASDPTLGDFGGLSITVSVENVVPSVFASPARLDLYQSVPMGAVDPITGSTGPLAYLVGSFILNTDGTMTFTRGSSVTPPPPPPPPTLVAVTRSGNASTIYFTTTNGATYTLYYANAAGLGGPVSSWAASSATVVGNGGTNSLSDTTTDAIRFYRVGAQ